MSLCQMRAETPILRLSCPTQGARQSGMLEEKQMTDRWRSIEPRCEEQPFAETCRKDMKLENCKPVNIVHSRGTGATNMVTRTLKGYHWTEGEHDCAIVG